jgi:hypothetical protein
MMLSAVGNGLQAAFLLARGRADGLRHVETGPDGAARSFFAAMICLPGFLCLRLLDWVDAGVPLRVGHALAADLLAFVIAWAGFALISRHVAILLGREDRWPRYIAAWNWCNVAQYGLLVAAGLPGLLGAPDFVQQACGLIALGWALWLEWYATHLALEIRLWPAVGLVALDVFVMSLIEGAASLIVPMP